MVEPEHLRINTNGITLHAAVAGPESGPLVILLHGFPEFWYGWRKAIDPLVARGFRVIVPDQRGYNISDKPHGIAAYAIDELGKDVVGLIDWAKKERAHLVAHDWGAAVAWWTAVAHRDRVDRLVVLNCPHPVVMDRYMKTNPTQLRKSWYIFFFQLPMVPEALFARDDGARMIAAITEMARPGSFSAEDLERYRQAWREKGATRGMVNWYRAALRAQPKRPSDLRVQVPTLIIWGKRDPILSFEMAGKSLELCDQGRLEVLDDATHWVLHEEEARVHGLILEHLQPTR